MRQKTRPGYSKLRRFSEARKRTKFARSISIRPDRSAYHRIDCACILISRCYHQLASSTMETSAHTMSASVACLCASGVHKQTRTQRVQ